MKKIYFLCLLAFTAASCQDYAEEYLAITDDSISETRAAEAGSTDYYWYNGKKINLIRNEKYVNVITDGKLTKSPKDEVMANSMTRSGEAKYLLPFFERGEGVEPIGTSDIFYLKLKDSDDVRLLEKMAAELGVQVIEEIPYTLRWYTLSIFGSEFSSSIEASNYFYETGKFEDVDPAFMFDFKPSADDPEFWRQWGMNNTTHSEIDINVIPTWNITRGAGIKVAVVDTPIQSNHDDLNDNMHSLSYNALLKQTPSAPFVQGAYPYDIGAENHGTHVAGIIAAEKNDSRVTGVACESKIVRISHRLYFSSTMASELASGINWAWKSTSNGGAGVDVINCSWGDRDANHNVHMELHSTVLEQAIADAMTQGRGNKGCVVVFAAGNSGSLGAIINYPANFHDDILAVGSIDQTGIRSSSSGYGTKLDIVAPGGSVWSTIPQNDTDYMSGTSMAAPHVSGIAALILSQNPNLTRQQVADAIINTADRYPSRYPEYGYGLVDATKALFYNRLSITGPAAPSTLANVSYSTTSNVSGATFNNWTVTPTSGVTISSPNSPNTTIRFTLSGNYNLKANYTLPGGTPYSGMKTITPIVTAPVTPIIHAETGGGGLPIPVGPGYQFIIQIDNYYGNGTIYEWDFVGLSKTGENGDLISVAVNSGMSAGSTVSARCRIRYGNNQYTGWSNTISTTYSPFVRRIMQNGEDQESI